MTPQPFSEYLYKKFTEWEETKKTAKKKRLSFSAFARWLSSNSLGKHVNQQAVDSWMNGTVPKDEKFILVLAEKLGDEVYDVLGIHKPNENVIYIQVNANRLDENMARIMRESMEKYLAEKDGNK